MNYLRALKACHDVLNPPNYVEIGCREGKSLALARCPSIGIDPDFEITTELTAPTRLFRQTSDAFFENNDLAALLREPLGLAFVDGMHLAEFALRDILNLERHSSPGTVIVVDDVVPERIGWATRDRKARAWTGDVYKVIPFLREHRPDLSIRVFDIEMKGLAVITNLDPANQTVQSALGTHESHLKGDAAALTQVSDLRKALMPERPEKLIEHLRTVAEHRACMSNTEHALA